MTQHTSHETKFSSECHKKRPAVVACPEKKRARRRVSTDSTQVSSVPTETMMTMEQKQEWMRRRFQHNEETILPIVQALSAAVKQEKGSPRIRQLLSQLDNQVDLLCWQFIESHPPALSLKPAKKLFKSRGENPSQVVQLRKKMRTRYEKNKEAFGECTAVKVCRISSLARVPKQESNKNIGSNHSLKSEPKKTSPQSSSPKATGIGQGDMPLNNNSWQRRYFEIDETKYTTTILPKYPAMMTPRSQEETSSSVKTGRGGMDRDQNILRNSHHKTLPSRQVHDRVKVEPAVHGTGQFSPSAGTGDNSTKGMMNNASVAFHYGTPQDEIAMRAWLDSHLLPQTTADYLLRQGARCVEDVRLLLQECPDRILHLPPLDVIKLKKACTQITPVGSLVRIKQEDDHVKQEAVVSH
eukprot:scaffold1872_cov262-Amphora_coffeaeformis.AAC.19